MAFNVAVDGPAGAGKSTVAKAVAAIAGKAPPATIAFMWIPGRCTGRWRSTF